jgi:hypothetical protein
MIGKGQVKIWQKESLMSKAILQIHQCFLIKLSTFAAYQKQQ